MAKRTLISVATLLTLGLAACSSDRPSSAPGVDRAAGGDTVKVAGCLSTGENGRFVLTAAPDPGVTTAARAGMGERDTHSYVLTGGSNLQSYMGKRVEVTGTIVGREEELESQARTRAEGTPTGTSGRTPTVATKEEVDLEIRQLNVSDVRELAPTCQVNP